MRSNVVLVAALVLATPAFAQRPPDLETPRSPVPAPTASPTPGGATTPAQPPAAGNGSAHPATPTEPEAEPKGGTTLLPTIDIRERPQTAARPRQVTTAKRQPSAPRTAPPTPAPATPPSTRTPAAASPATPADAATNAPPQEVRLSPVAGSEIPIGKVPGSVATVGAADIARSGDTTIEQALQTSVPGLVVTDAQGNAFQTDIQYRGFSASPVDGVPQGLAVYQNGVRINEAFGDTLNWDFLPPVAIRDIPVISNNPVFGLNALGGAVSIDMKDGFGFHGVETDTRIGSFGRRQGSLQVGQQFGPWAAYVALEDIHDDGYRISGSSDIRRMYADLGVKGDGREFHLDFTGADNVVGVAAASPLQLLDTGWDRVFTTPQSTTNTMGMVSLNGSVQVADALKVSGVAYYRHFLQRHVDGNISKAVDCQNAQNQPQAPGMFGTLCLDNLDGSTTQLRDQTGRTIATPANIGEIDRTSIDARSYGGSIQAVDKTRLLGHGNQLLIGTSIDRGEVRYAGSAEIGSVDPGTFVVTGGGSIVANSDLHPVALATANTYWGLYFADTFDVTSRLALTAGGRFNVARIDLADANGLSPSLTGSQTYQRFNPMVGATYELMPGLSLYGGYSEANRAPVPAELACADPAHPCLVPAFLTSDPALKQIVAHTVDLGVRGSMRLPYPTTGRFDWGLGAFRTLDTDDIVNGYSTLIGRSYVQNAGNTLRQGIEAKAAYRSDDWLVYANYAWVAATFQSSFTIDSPNNPLNPSIGDSFPTQVVKGDRLPGIPEHTFKLGFDYRVTPEWKAGADLLVVSDAVTFGDEANLNRHLPGYATLNLHTSYDVTKNVEIYGLVNNVTNTRYATYGTYFDTTRIGSFSDPRSVVPAQPSAAYGGVKLRF